MSYWVFNEAQLDEAILAYEQATIEKRKSCTESITVCREIKQFLTSRTAVDAGLVRENNQPESDGNLYSKKDLPYFLKPQSGL